MMKPEQLIEVMLEVTEELVELVKEYGIQYADSLICHHMIDRHNKDRLQELDSHKEKMKEIKNEIDFKKNHLSELRKSLCGEIHAKINKK